ncbi:MAG: MbnP family protein [Bacteroidota bacterium]
MKSYFLLAFVAFGLFSLQSCTNNEGCMDPFALNYDADADEAGDCDYSNLTLQFVAKVGTEDFAYNTYYDINGVKVSFSRAQFYLSRVTLEGDGEASIYSTETYNIVKAGTTDYNAGQLRAGTIQELSFNVGVDASVNNNDPTALPADDPLSSENPDFAHWSWDAGYQFITLEGSVDTDNDGQEDKILEYHLGRNSNLRQVVFENLDFTVDEATEVITVTVDFAKLFDNIDPATENITHVGDFPDVATKVLDNISAAFTR